MYKVTLENEVKIFEDEEILFEYKYTSQDSFIAISEPVFSDKVRNYEKIDLLLAVFENQSIIMNRKTERLLGVYKLENPDSIGIFKRYFDCEIVKLGNYFFINTRKKVTRTSNFHEATFELLVFFCMRRPNDFENIDILIQNLGSHLSSEDLMDLAARGCFMRTFNHFLAKYPFTESDLVIGLQAAARCKNYEKFKTLIFKLPKDINLDSLKLEEPVSPNILSLLALKISYGANP